MSTTFKDRTSALNKYIIDLSKYKIIKKINSGGFGDIYSIQNKKTKEMFAAKILSTSEEEGDGQRKRLINREIGIMIRMQHPTIIRFYGFSLQDFDGQDNVTIIMDLAKNGSLSTLLQNVRKGLANKSYDNTARQKILIGIAYGMMYLHKNHIIHRDLKPGNILLDENLNPHITDFGLSKIIISGRSQTQTQSYGTSIYMAPEVINGDKYDGKADVYSFSILMYEVVTDSIPYPLYQSNKMTLFQFNEKVVHKKYRPEFTMPIKESFKKLITQCWSENPKERPTFEELFNLLAFNLEDSVHDIFEGENGNKFYLDDVDANEVLNYAYDISENDFNSPENMIVEVKRDNEKLREQIESQSKLIKKLADENEELRNDKSKIESELKSNSQLIKKLKSDNEEILRRLAKIEGEMKNVKNEEVSEPKTPEKRPKPSSILTEKRIKTPEKVTVSSSKSSIPPFKSDLKILDFPYKKSHEFEGIIKYLTDKTGGNIHDNGTIEVTTNSCDKDTFHPKNLLIYNSDIYQADYGTDIWVCFDFKDMEIELTSYTIKSSHWKSGISHLKNWEIQISNDKKKWTTIDSHKNSSELNGPHIIKNFPVKCDRFARYYRLYNTGEFWGSNEKYVLEFISIEFFGRLRIPGSL